jgi:hypothetical protein
MKIKSDERLNKELQKEVQDLRELIIKNNKNNSERFIAKKSTEMPRMIITDTETGKTTEVPLFAYSDVMKVLKELFEN